MPEKLTMSRSVIKPIEQRRLRGFRQFMALGEYYLTLAATLRSPRMVGPYRFAMLASGRAYMAARALRDGHLS